MFPGDARSKIPKAMFDDPRVTSFWDPHELSGRWFGNHRIGDLEGGIIWDAYYAFPARTTWHHLKDRVLATGAPVIGGTDGLKREFVPLLKDAKRPAPIDRELHRRCPEVRSHHL
jgi:hypothetical protein